jgi:hypothetical protein
MDGRNPPVIFAGSFSCCAAAKAATTTIPIVFTTGGAGQRRPGRCLALDRGALIAARGLLRPPCGMCALNQLASTYSSASCVGVRYSPASLRGSYCTSRHSTNLKLGAISRAKSHLLFSSEPFDISAPNRLIGLLCGCLLRMYCAP